MTYLLKLLTNIDRTNTEPTLIGIDKETKELINFLKTIMSFMSSVYLLNNLKLFHDNSRNVYEYQLIRHTSNSSKKLGHINTTSLGVGKYVF